MYFVDGSAPERAKQVKASSQGELEITCLLETYLNEGTLRVEKKVEVTLGFQRMHLYLMPLKLLLTDEGLQVGSPDEFIGRWITKDQLIKRAQTFEKNMDVFEKFKRE